MASVITIAFENWKAQEAANGKPVLLNEFVFANVPNLDPTKPIDRNEKLPPANQIVHRQAVSKSGLASENAVAYSVTLGAEIGDFDFNWIGLLNKESGTVAMITHAPIQKKLKTKDGQQGNVLIRSFLLEFNGAAEETQIKTSAETWQIDFTARLSGIDEMQRLVNLDSYGAAAFFDDGFQVTRNAEQFTVKKGLGYVGGLRGQLEQNQILNGLRNIQIYADFSYQGNIVSQWNTVVKITAAATLNNYVDAAGFTHQVFAIASVDASGNVKDLRLIGDLNTQELARMDFELDKKLDKAGGTVTGDLTLSKNAIKSTKGTHSLPEESGIFMQVGDFGVGASAIPLPNWDEIKETGIYTSVKNSQDELPMAVGGLIVFHMQSGVYASQICFRSNKSATFTWRRSKDSNGWGNWYASYGEGNTTKDDNGFLRTGNATALTTSNVVQIMGTSSANVMSQKAVTDIAFGVGQTWKDVTTLRKANVKYVNTTGKMIAVSATAIFGDLSQKNEPYITFKVDGVYTTSSAVSYPTFTTRFGIITLVPPGVDYMLEATNIDSVSLWSELS